LVGIARPGTFFTSERFHYGWALERAFPVDMEQKEQKKLRGQQRNTNKSIRTTTHHDHHEPKKFIFLMVLSWWMTTRNSENSLVNKKQEGYYVKSRIYFSFISNRGEEIDITLDKLQKNY
jgi:hypothetical protein